MHAFCKDMIGPLHTKGCTSVDSKWQGMQRYVSRLPHVLSQQTFIDLYVRQRK